MESDFNSAAKENFSPSLVQLELLEALLSEDAIYPWEPLTPEAEALLFEQEQESGLANLSADETATGRARFFWQLDQIWSNTAAESLSPSAQAASIADNLSQQFAQIVPSSWLETIVSKAYQAIATPKSTADKLVDCVQDLLTNLTVDDLLVLARPFAGAMRSPEINLVTIRDSLRCRDWQELTTIEQARLSIAIANYALTQLQQGEAETE